jgi:hypothetical protein
MDIIAYCIKYNITQQQETRDNDRSFTDADIAAADGAFSSLSRLSRLLC